MRKGRLSKIRVNLTREEIDDFLIFTYYEVVRKKNRYIVYDDAEVSTGLKLKELKDGGIIIRAFLDMPPKSFFYYYFLGIFFGVIYVKEAVSFADKIMRDLKKYDEDMRKERRRKHRYRTYQTFNAMRIK